MNVLRVAAVAGVFIAAPVSAAALAGVTQWGPLLVALLACIIIGLALTGDDA
jgi:hypothetical protein